MTTTPPPYSASPALHPHNLATLATLRGRSPICAFSARILVQGLADVGDLIPLAAYLPEAELVAVDPSAAQLEDAESIIRRLGRTNVELIERPLTESLADQKPFDYILVRDGLARQDLQGRRALLGTCAGALSDRGLLVVGYPALPGWGPMRDLCAWLRSVLGARGQEGPTAKRVDMVRSLVEPFVPQGDEPPEPGMEGLATLASVIKSMDSDAIIEDVLGGTLEPLRLAAVVEEATAAGLHYLGDAQREPSHAQLTQTLAAALAPQVDDVAHLEVLGDLTMPRGWRTSTFTKAESPTAGDGRLIDLDARLVALRLRPERGALDLEAETETFVGPYEVKIEVESRLLRAMIGLVAGVWPRAIPVIEAIEQAGTAVATADTRWAMQINEEAIRETKERLLSLCEMGLADLRTEEPPIARDIQETPTAHLLVRLQAEAGPWVTSPLHLDVELAPMLHALIRCLDGTHDAASVETKMDEALSDGIFDLNVDGEEPKDPVARRMVLRSHIVQGLGHLQALGLLERNQSQSETPPQLTR